MIHPRWRVISCFGMPLSTREIARFRRSRWRRRQLWASWPMESDWLAEESTEKLSCGIDCTSGNYDFASILRSGQRIRVRGVARTFTLIDDDWHRSCSLDSRKVYRRIHCWDPELGTQQVVLDGLKGTGIQFALSPDDSHVVSATADATSLWETQSGKLIQCHRRSPTHFVLSRRKSPCSRGWRRPDQSHERLQTRRSRTTMSTRSGTIRSTVWSLVPWELSSSVGVP